MESNPCFSQMLYVKCFRPSFEVVREGRNPQLGIKTVFEDIIIWQVQNDSGFWTT